MSADWPHDALLLYVAERIHLDPPQDLEPCVGAMVLSNGKPSGAVLFNNYRELPKGRTMEITAVCDDPGIVSRRLLREIFEYAFEKAGVSVLMAQCSRVNSRSRSILERLGFRLDGISRRAYDGSEDAMIYSMLPGECKWL